MYEFIHEINSLRSLRKKNHHIRPKTITDNEPSRIPRNHIDLFYRYTHTFNIDG